MLYLEIDSVGLYQGVFLLWVIYGDGQCWTVPRSIPGVGYIWGETVLDCSNEFSTCWLYVQTVGLISLR